MPAQNWREVYELALLELDTSKLPGRVEAALRAIQQRLWQKKETLTRKEREEIDDALRALVEVTRRRGAQAPQALPIRSPRRLRPACATLRRNPDMPIPPRSSGVAYSPRAYW